MNLMMTAAPLAMVMCNHHAKAPGHAQKLPLGGVFWHRADRGQFQLRTYSAERGKTPAGTGLRSLDQRLIGVQAFDASTGFYGEAPFPLRRHPTDARGMARHFPVQEHREEASPLRRLRRGSVARPASI